MMDPPGATISDWTPHDFCDTLLGGLHSLLDGYA